MVHGEVRPRQAEGFHAVGSPLQDLRHLLHLLRRKLAKHEIYLAAARETVAHAETKPGVSLGAEFRRDVFQAVMPIITNTPDYSFILFGVEEFTKNIYEYRNSARGILKGLMADAKESNLELEDIVKDINLAPESLEMVKNVLDKLG